MTKNENEDENEDVMNIKIRLIIMNFLQFAVWGAYLTSMGGYWFKEGFGEKIWIFYAMQGIVSLFMPALMGIIADKWVQAQRLLSLCHLVAGASMLGLGLYAMSSVGEAQFGILMLLYTVSVAFYMPTLALSNSVAYNALDKAGLDTVRHFPPIRLFGTVGFVCSMLTVNFMTNGDQVQWQLSHEQFLLSGSLSLLLCVYALTLTPCPVRPRGEHTQTFAEATGLNAFGIFKDRKLAMIFVFSMLLGASLQITNGYANPYITHFKMLPEYAGSWWANNANALISISQISETVCIVLIPFFLRRFGIKTVVLISMIAWVLRFLLFGMGDPGSRAWMLILSCLVYGVAFDFFNISISLHIDKNVGNDMRSSAQGLLMLMVNGLGSTLGTVGAGMVVNHYVFAAQEPSWSMAWFVFAAYALVVAVLFAVLYREELKR